MKSKILYVLVPWILATLACSFSSGGRPASPFFPPAATSTNVSFTETSIPIPTLTETLTPIPTDTSAPTETSTPTPVPVVESMKAKVTAGKLSCRYGPGAEYLFLYALNGTANIKLVGRTDANNWVWVDGKNKCWVNAEYLDINGDPRYLPIVYPGIAKLPGVTLLSRTQLGECHTQREYC